MMLPMSETLGSGTPLGNSPSQAHLCDGSPPGLPILQPVEEREDGLG